MKYSIAQKLASRNEIKYTQLARRVCVHNFYAQSHFLCGTNAYAPVRHSSTTPDSGSQGPKKSTAAKDSSDEATNANTGDESRRATSASAASDLSLRLALIGDELHGADYQGMMEKYERAQEEGTDSEAVHIALAVTMARRELAAYRRVSLLCIQRAILFIAVFGGYATYKEAEKMCTVESSASGDERGPPVSYLSSSAEDSLMAYLGVLSLVAGVAISAIYVSLFSAALSVDYLTIMWERYFQNSSKAGGKENSKQLDYHVEIVTKAFPLYVLSSAVSSYILFFVRLHMARRGKRMP